MHLLEFSLLQLYNGRKKEEIDSSGSYHPLCSMEYAQKRNFVASCQFLIKGLISIVVKLFVRKPFIKRASETRNTSNQTQHKSSVLHKAYDMASQKVMSA